MESDNTPPTKDSNLCCGHNHAHIQPVEQTPTEPAKSGVALFRIPTMDCAAEEAEIRHALAKLPGLRSLSFQLGARTIAIDAPSESCPKHWQLFARRDLSQHL